MNPKAGATGAPQCTSAEREGDELSRVLCGGVGELQIGGGHPNRRRYGGDDDDGAGLNSLSDDVLFDVFLYCGPTDVEERLKLVNRRFHNATSLSSTLWKEFCILTGKAVDAKFARDGASSPEFERRTNESDDGIADEDNVYRRYYFRNPCVPVDFASIQEALDHCPRTPASAMRSLGEEATVGTVVLMPGVYDERIHIGGEPWAMGQSFDKGLAIRAAFPAVGATIRSRQRYDASDETKDCPCIAISTCDEDALAGVQKGISVRLAHLQILHSSPGADIWNGNAVVAIEGPRAQVVIDSCLLQSDSGRGLVVTNQAVTEVYRTSIVDCAATGFYLGDWGSRARISGCNVVRNGFGSRRLRPPSNDEGLPIPSDGFEAVPPGHSGIYIESSMCWIDDSLIAGNSLTGLSVVRGGFVSLSASDVTENGNVPIQIEDAYDARANNNRLQGISIRGGVVEGPVKNNYTSVQQSDKRLFKGGVIREGESFSDQIL